MGINFKKKKETKGDLSRKEYDDERRKKLESEFAGVVHNNLDYKKILYKGIDFGIGLSFISGAILGLSIIAVALGYNLIISSVLFLFSFLLFSASRYFGLRKLFLKSHYEDEDDDEMKEEE